MVFDGLGRAQGPDFWTVNSDFRAPENNRPYDFSYWVGIAGITNGSASDQQKGARREERRKMKEERQKESQRENQQEKREKERRHTKEER